MKRLLLIGFAARTFALAPTLSASAMLGANRIISATPLAVENVGGIITSTNTGGRYEREREYEHED